jgi:hypothetical protein
LAALDNMDHRSAGHCQVNHFSGPHSRVSFRFEDWNNSGVLRHAGA